MRFGVDVLQPVEVALGIRVRQRVLPGEWWVSDYRVEPPVGLTEHLRELGLPVERNQRLVRLAHFLDQSAVALRLAGRHCTSELGALRFSFFRLCAGKKGEHSKIAEESHA